MILAYAGMLLRQAETAWWPLTHIHHHVSGSISSRFHNWVFHKMIIVCGELRSSCGDGQRWCMMHEGSGSFGPAVVVAHRQHDAKLRHSSVVSSRL